MLVKEIMTPALIKVKETDSIAFVAQKMADCNIGALPVVKNGDVLVGIVTDRDIVVKADAKNMDLTTTVESIMSKDIQSCAPDDDIEDAASLMAVHQVRRLPVAKDGHVVGFLALADLAVSMKDKPEVVHGMLSKISKPAKPECEAA